MIHVHYSRVWTRVHTNSWLAQVEGVSLGVTGCRTAQEAATGQKGCLPGGLPLHPVTCWAPCTNPKVEGKPVGLFWFAFRSPSQILYCVSGKLLTDQLEYYLYHSQCCLQEKKDSCVTMNQQMEFLCWVLSFSCVVGGQEMNSWASQCCLPGASNELPPIVQCLKCCQEGYFQEKARPSDRCGTARSQRLHWRTWEQLLARAKPSPGAGECAECGSAERAALILG